ncbi:MAG TPA: DUF2244 domain-containing protein [Caulobacteraceae bacterium]|nr:DUF2244 domain-containing protein [Caulobacteraceae bacterium]
MSGPLYMDAVITPHRSLSRRGFIVVIGALTAINTTTAVLFIAMHASPVPIFLGLAVIALACALIASQRATRRRERIQVTASEVRVMVESPAGAQTVWVSPTAFTRLAQVGEEDTELELRLSDRTLAVARALTRAERRDFALALEQAIRRARNGPVAI